MTFPVKRSLLEATKSLLAGATICLMPATKKDPRTLQQVVQHNLREAIIRSGLSKAEIERRTRKAVSARTVQSIRGLRPKPHAVQLQHLEALAKLFGIEPWVLLIEGADIHNPPTTEEVRLTSMALRRIAEQGEGSEDEESSGAPGRGKTPSNPGHRTSTSARRSDSASPKAAARRRSRTLLK